MNKEKKFLIPEAEIIVFPSEDIIVTSDVGEKNAGEIPEWPPVNP